MKKYFIYELKKSSFTIACLSVIITLLYLVILLSTEAGRLGINAYTTYLAVPAYSGAVLAFAVPFRQLDYKMKKRSADLFFSLPLSHSKIIAVKFLTGLIIVFAPYTLSYWLGAFAMMIKTSLPVNAVFYIPHFFITLLPLYIVYAVSSFAFTRAGKASDGVLFSAFWMIAPMLAVAVLGSLIKGKPYTDIEGVPYLYDAYFHPEYYSVFSPLSYFTSLFAELISADGYFMDTSSITIANMIVGFALTALMGAGASAGLFIAEKNARFENIEQISDSLFGYKTALPYLTVCLTALCHFAFFLAVFVAVGAFLLTAVYRRTLKIGNKQAIIYAASLTAGIILALICAYVL